jgi:GAF domain-containing protein/ActR/RegA family two-component response regulator
MVSAWLADLDGSALRPLSGYHVPKHLLDPSLKFPIPLEGHRFLEKAWESKSAVYSSDAPADLRIDRETFERLPHRSILFCPMLLQGEPTGGLFAIWWEQAHQFSPEELRLVEGISQQAALAAESARLYAEAERRRKAAESLAHVGRLISQSLEPEEVGRQIVGSLLGLLNARASILFRLEPASGNLVALALGGEVEPRLSESIVLPKGIGVAGLVVQERRPVATPDILSDPRITITPEVRARIIQGPGRALLAAPLIFKDVVIGALGVRDRTGRVFNTEEIHLLQAFADQAAIALENSRLHAEHRHVEAVATALAEVGNELVRTLDTTALNERIVATVLRVFGVRRATLYRFDPASESLVCVAGAEAGVPDPGRWIGKKLGPGEGTAGRAISERRPVWSPDVLGDPSIALPEWLREFLEKDDSRSACVVPLIAQAEILGAVVLGDTRGRTYSQEELRLLSAFGDLAAVGTVNARLYAEAERRRRSAESLAEVGRLVSQSLEPEEVRRRIAESVRMLLNALNSAILQLEPESGDLVITTVSGEVGPALDPGVVFPRGTGLAAISMLERRPLATPDMLSDPRILLTPELRARIEQAPQRAVLSVPLVVKDTVIGTLSIGDRAGRAFDAEEIRLVQAFADQAAIALENARLYGELRSALLELEASQQRIVQTERLKALGELAGGVAHDFNNMLGIILGRAQLLRIQSRDRAFQQQLRVIEHAALDGARTVQRIQEFTRRRPARPFESVNLNKVVEEVVEVTRARWKDEAQARGFRYDVRVEATPLPPVAGDPSELREALTNLVFNALEAMPQGGQLTLSTGAKRKRVYCAVADTGVGMPEEVKRRVFEPFFTTKVEKGSGLGLSVAYGIVSRHGGEIEVQSQVGQGSAFTIWLPTGRQIAGAPKKVPAPPSPRPAKILVIEDEPEIRKLLVDLLAGQGHTVAACPDGASGLARFQAGPFDLVITDLGMPGLSGWEVARLVKERRPETPVTLITGWGDQIDPEEARANGVEFLVTKPFKLAEVTAVVSQALTPPAPSARAPNARPTPAS